MKASPGAYDAAAIHDFEAASPINRGRPQGELMALKIRPTGCGIDQDREGYAMFCGEWNIGEHLRWFWALRAAGL